MRVWSWPAENAGPGVVAVRSAAWGTGQVLVKCHLPATPALFTILAEARRLCCTHAQPPPQRPVLFLPRDSWCSSCLAPSAGAPSKQALALPQGLGWGGSSNGHLQTPHNTCMHTHTRPTTERRAQHRTCLQRTHHQAHSCQQRQPAPAAAACAVVTTLLLRTRA